MAQNTSIPVSVPPMGLGPLVLYFLKLGTLGFGGPAALIGFMYRDLVEQRRWISEDTYKLSLALSLASLPLDRLERLASDPTAGIVGPSVGDARRDLVFTPLTPCRVAVVPKGRIDRQALEELAKGRVSPLESEC